MVCRPERSREKGTPSAKATTPVVWKSLTSATPSASVWKVKIDGFAESSAVSNASIDDSTDEYADAGPIYWVKRFLTTNETLGSDRLAATSLFVNEYCA